MLKTILISIVKWLLRLGFMAILCCICLWLFAIIINDNSSQYYKDFSTMMTQTSRLHVPINKLDSFKQQFHQCQMTTKAFGKLDIIKKCIKYHPQY